jgi:hypothetical protein
VSLFDWRPQFVFEVKNNSIKTDLTIPFSGEYPETLIDLTLGNRLNTLRDALASFLSVPINQIQILAIHAVFQYRNPCNTPLPFDQEKQQALTDVIFYVPSLNKQEIKNKLNANINQFSSRFRLIVNAIDPDPCNNYSCPISKI